LSLKQLSEHTVRGRPTANDEDPHFIQRDICANEDETHATWEFNPADVVADGPVCVATGVGAAGIPCHFKAALAGRLSGGWTITPALPGARQVKADHISYSYDKTAWHLSGCGALLVPILDATGRYCTACCSCGCGACRKRRACENLGAGGRSTGRCGPPGGPGRASLPFPGNPPLPSCGPPARGLDVI
jgi:hypothetical protein